MNHQILALWVGDCENDRDMASTKGKIGIVMLRGMMMTHEDPS